MTATLTARGEMDRVLSLPIDTGLTEAEVDEMTRAVVRPSWHGRLRLRPTQAWSLITLMELDGLFAPITVGGGKTLISIKGCADMYHKKDHRRVLLVVPSNVYAQTVHDISWLGERVHLYNMPFHLLGGRPRHIRERIAKSKKRGCYVMTYGILSSPGAEDLIRWIEPTFTMWDEVHEIKNERAARTGRVMRFLNEFQPRFGCLSGTISTKSLMDYHHLIRQALKDQAPVPKAKSDAQEWAQAFDANAGAAVAPHIFQRIKPLIEWARQNRETLSLPSTDDPIKARRDAYRARLSSSPGVVHALSSEGVDCSLVLLNEELQHDSERLQQLIDQVELEDITPSGDTIPHAMLKTKWRAELSAGFCNLRVWPDLEWIDKHKKIDMDSAELLDRSKVWHGAHNEYNSILRKWLSRRGKKDLDTPMLVGKDMALHGATNVGSELYESWMTARRLDFEGRLEQRSEVLRISDYKVQHAVKVASSAAWKKHGGILWYYHNAIGSWLRELLPDAIYCPAGDDGNQRILFESKGRVTIASIGAHHQGKNLQFHRHNLFVEWPRSDKLAEQVLGRTHRPGQTEDQLVMQTVHSTSYDHEALSACLNDTCYMQQTTPGARMKLMVATFQPPPKVLPSHVLVERGFHDVKTLDDEAQRLLEEKFQAT